MKLLSCLLCLILAGCQTAAPLPPLPPTPKLVPVASPLVAVPSNPTSSALELKVRQQAQYIDALISQNEALAVKLAGPASGTVSAPEPTPAARIPAVGVTPLVPADDLLMPNAEGVIDLTAIASNAKPGESVNPFAVRTLPAGAVREVTLHVSGILAGKTPYAVINERLVQPNETVEALTVERIEADAVCLRFAGQRLRVPVSEQTVRVKLPL